MRTLWQATRPYSFPAAAVPVAVGTALAPLLHPGLGVNWSHAALVLAGTIAAQAVSNLVNDLVDAGRGLDHAGNAGRDNPIVAGTLGPGAMVGLAVAIGAAGLVIAAWLTRVAGPPVAWLAAAGALFAVFYTAPPVALKYRALGDVAVFTAFGALILTGAYFVQAHAVPDPRSAPGRCARWRPTACPAPCSSLRSCMPTTTVIAPTTARPARAPSRTCSRRRPRAASCWHCSWHPGRGSLARRWPAPRPAGCCSRCSPCPPACQSRAPSAPTATTATWCRASRASTASRGS
jgi:hypothetical protein